MRFLLLMCCFAATGYSQDPCDEAPAAEVTVVDETPADVGVNGKCGCGNKPK